MGAAAVVAVFGGYTGSQHSLSGNSLPPTRATRSTTTPTADHIPLNLVHPRDIDDGFIPLTPLTFKTLDFSTNRNGRLAVFCAMFPEFNFRTNEFEFSVGAYFSNSEFRFSRDGRNWLSLSLSISLCFCTWTDVSVSFSPPTVILSLSLQMSFSSVIWHWFHITLFKNVNIKFFYLILMICIDFIRRPLSS